MRVGPWLCCLVPCVWTVNANVEKTIFLGPPPTTFSNAPPSLLSLQIDTLSPEHALTTATLATLLPVQFPSPSAPRGQTSWYLLQGLEEGRRYEVRICWPATSPTDFWLDTFSIAQVFGNPELLFPLGRYIEQRQAISTARIAPLSPKTPQSVLLLRIQAAASFYSTNRTLMEHPLPVDADIILDPFIFNILPRSLAATGAYITIVAIGAWFLSGFIYRWLVSVAAEPLPKPHSD